MESSHIADASITYSDEQLLRKRGYQFIKQLGEGSYAKVYLTNHEQSGRPDATLACKVINARKAPREFVTKFLPRELDIIGKVAHPNIIHIAAIFHIEHKFLIFMRYAENGDLLEYILRKGEVKESVARVWLYQLSLALQYLHVLDIAHRDIKCENVLISANYNIKLADFGFARFVALSGRQVMSTTYCGSLIYASPEIIKGKPYFPKCSDVWSLGIVTYIMLNKTMPFSESNSRQLYKLQMAQQWSFRRRILPALTQGIVAMVTKMLEPNFKARVTIDDILQDVYFKEAALEMTETEKAALNFAVRHKSELQHAKSFDMADIANTHEQAKEAYTSTVIVSADSRVAVDQPETTAVQGVTTVPEVTTVQEPTTTQEPTDFSFIIKAVTEREMAHVAENDQPIDVEQMGTNSPPAASQLDSKMEIALQ
ncbi:testis-specific serine threonine-protein kinase [Nesidiocoris tenuis]|uniref:Testis-specific serine threonine-protein kinase n=1 Tax=Nesidiocoris tenuis TaxID=355587 RepID=A0ABN7B554_9HEMI|nr:testis-specific serine threonine-protein kinase [Nesidiocoris tenuis]